MNGHSDVFRRLTNILGHIFCVKFRQRIALADATHRHRTVQAQEQLALVSQTNVMPRQRIVQHGNHLLRDPRIERNVGHQRVLAILLCQFPEQIGETGAGRHLAAKQLHAVARSGLQRQVVAVEPLAHFHHVTLQRRTADKPLIRQILQLERKRRGKKTDHQIVHALRPGAGNAQRARV